MTLIGSLMTSTAVAVTTTAHLLEHEDCRKRGLWKIKRCLGGFESDDTLRRALMRAGAVAIGGYREDEMWGLLRRNKSGVT